MSEKPSIPTLPHRENVTAAQFNTLLGIFNHAANFLVASQVHGPQEDGSGGGRLDGGAKASVETTIMHVCDRMNAMINDKSRWSLGDHDKLTGLVHEAYTQHGRMLKAQADAYAEITSPHHRLKPQMVKLGDGTWLAFAGNPADLDNAMCGVGNNPKQALESFDALFAGEVPEHLKGWLAAREKAIEAGQTPPDVGQYTNEKQKSNEKQKLDETGTEHPPTPAPRRKKQPRNRGTLGPNGPIS